MARQNDNADDKTVWIVAAVLLLALLPLLACGGVGLFLILRRPPANPGEVKIVAKAPPPVVVDRPQRKFPPELPGEPAAGPLNGLWSGAYHYPNPSPPVTFEISLRHTEDGIAGNTKEPNTFGRKGEPWLFADCAGKFDPATRKVAWTKKYDGTAGVTSSAEYSGELSPDGGEIDGIWVIRAPGQADFSGRFTLQKLNRAKKDLK